MADAINIKFEVVGSPAFQIEYNPKICKFFPIDNFNTSTNYQKVKYFQHLSMGVEFELIWEQNHGIDETQYNQLYSLFKTKRSSSFYIYPNPDAMPTLKYLVSWIDEKFNFQPSSGSFVGFQWYGSMRLVNAEALTASDFPAIQFNQYTT